MGDSEVQPNASDLSGRTLSVADYLRLGRELAKQPSGEGMLELRTAILSSCTLQFIEPFLVVEGVRRRVRLRTYYGPFGQFEQQIADPGSGLHEFGPEALVVVMRPEDIDPDVFARHYADQPNQNSIDRVMDRIVECVTRFREGSSAPVLVANFAVPARLPLGPFDANVEESLTGALAAANASLRKRLSTLPATAIWDYAGLVRETGSGSWSDPRLWALGRIPVASQHQPALARHLVRSIAALVRPPAKCLVLDLDNTVWGGVIGDDGMEGIQLGDDYPGNVFKAFQRAALGLTDRGILLAVVSKNDPDVAGQALRDHPEMLIRPEHLSAVRINWSPKSQNLREIAAELNIGLDALVLFDDNPAERAEVAANSPEVRVVDVPRDALGYEQALHECGFFDAPLLLSEDRQRVQMYRQERTRDEVRASAATVDEYITVLEMEAQVGRVDSANLGRVAQLIGKTNQFNLTTRRHSQAVLARMCDDPDCAVSYLRLRDKYGDQGLIAVGVIVMDQGRAVIDSFVMSCRAMGRRVEVALAAELVGIARELGCHTIVGEYIPTPRNGIVADFYADLGFARLGDESTEGALFTLDLSRSTVEWPGAIRRIPVLDPAPA